MILETSEAGVGKLRARSSLQTILYGRQAKNFLPTIKKYKDQSKEYFVTCDS